MVMGYNLRRQRGLAMVELAVTAPLLLLLMFATAEIGRAFMQYNTLTKSVRDSVRHVAEMALPGQTGVIQIDSDLEQAAQNLVVFGRLNAGGNTPLLPGLSPANVQVNASTADDVTVTATYAYQPMFGVIPGFTITADRNAFYVFQAQATMRAL